MSTEQCTAVTYGIDLGKTWFHVVGLDTAGSPVKRAKLNRASITRFFVNLPRALVGMDACPGSQWLARKLQALGHEVRIVPAQFVKPYVKSNKNDTIDAEAIAQPTMRFVQIKHCEQVDLQALHHSRELLVSTRTRLINQMRAFCLEYGVAIRNGVGAFKVSLPTVLGDEGNDLPMPMRGRSHAALAAPGAPVAACHVRAGGRLIQKDQPVWRQATLPSPPLLARLLCVGPILLAGVQRFFISR